MPYQVNYYGNPHSRTHAYGWESESAMETARKVERHLDCSERGRERESIKEKLKYCISELVLYILFCPFIAVLCELMFKSFI